MRFSVAALILLSLALCQNYADAFVPICHSSKRTAAVLSKHFVSTEVDRPTKSLEDDDDDDDDDDGKPNKIGANLPQTLRIQGRGIPARNSKIQLLDTSTYESSLIQKWEENPERQRGFDWEIEKLRRYFAGLRMRDDGTWVRQPSPFQFLVSKHRIASSSTGAPSPVNLLDVVILVAKNLLSSVGFGPALGMAAVPNAVIQKYEGSFFSFIKGVLGGDLQTLAGGPLFLLLAKYYRDYGPIFNLSFGPKSFLVISDPVMARHILRNASPDQYCKGMLAEILEPIMGKGLIPADPATWRVRIVFRVTTTVIEGMAIRDTDKIAFFFGAPFLIILRCAVAPSSLDFISDGSIAWLLSSLIEPKSLSMTWPKRRVKLWTWKSGSAPLHWISSGRLSLTTTLGR